VFLIESINQSVYFPCVHVQDSSGESTDIDWENSENTEVERINSISALLGQMRSKCRSQDPPLQRRCDNARGMQVESMSTAELQQQLQARNINTQGLTKFDLQDSLWASLQAEAGLLPAEDAAVS